VKCFHLSGVPGAKDTVNSYREFLLNSLRKLSRAIVMDGAFGFGALMSSLSPSCSTAVAVVGPKAAILTSPWTKIREVFLKRLYP